MLNFHCIIHQPNLYSKSLKMDHVIKVVIKSVNFIKSQSLNHCQLQEFLKSSYSEYFDASYYSEVRWLSHAEMLKRAYDLKHKIKLFLEKLFKNEKFARVLKINNSFVILHFLSI